MGFFSNKKENSTDKTVNQEKSVTKKKCQFCGNEQFQVMDNFKAPDNMVIDMSVLTKGNTGVCPNCGFIAHGNIIYKCSDVEISSSIAIASLGLLRLWCEKWIELKKRPNITSDELSRLGKIEFENFIKEFKSKIPEYFENVDFKNYVKLNLVSLF